MRTETTQNLALLAEKFFGVRLPVSEVSLKKAYRKACMLLHPDKGGNEKEFKAMDAAYVLLTSTSGVVSDMNGSGPLTTQEGISLSELGLGLGPTKNGRDCPRCSHLGYTKHFGETFSVCEECNTIGRVPRKVWCQDCQESGKFTLKSGRIVECRKCRGIGKFSHPYLTDWCKTCRGTKTIRKKVAEVYYVRCYECGGTGEIAIFNPLLPKGSLSKTF